MSLYKAIAGCYDELFPLKETRLSFINSIIKQKPLSLLDIGCASGELALALAKQGHHIIGIDLDEGMIQSAAAKAKKMNLKVDFLKKDMAQIGKDFSPGRFDAVFCLGNTLTHLASIDAIRSIFQGIHRVLKGEGKVLVQVVNYDYIISEKVKIFPRLESEHCTFYREYRYHEAKHRVDFISRLLIKKSGQTKENCESLYPLGFEELKKVLEKTCFTEMQFFGSEHREAFLHTSPALLAVATR